MFGQLGKLCAVAFWGLLSTVVYAETLSVYTFHEPPMNFTEVPNKSLVYGNDIKGFAPDVVREIMKRTGDKGDITMVPWARSYRLLESEPNVVLFSMARTPVRENLFQWVGPLAYSKSFLYVKKGSGISIKSLDDARRLERIGVMPEDSKEQFLKSNGFTNLDYSVQWASVFKKLILGRVSAMIMTDTDLPINAREAGFDIAEFEPAYLLFITQLYIGFSKSTAPELVQRWQSELDHMKKDGTFKQLAEKWATYWKVPWVVMDGAVQLAPMDAEIKKPIP
jgi:polar amino acid transport system substrate-binding protein